MIDQGVNSSFKFYNSFEGGRSIERCEQVVGNVYKQTTAAVHVQAFV